jgi:hypothetical protein
MTVAKDLAQMAVECGRKPGRESIWLRELGKYVCPDSEEEKGALLQSDRPPILHEERQHPALGPQFKLVFLTSVTLTVLFLALCVVLTLASGKEPPPLYEKLVMGLFDLVKIGAGTFLGLLAGKRL